MRSIIKIVLWAQRREKSVTGEVMKGFPREERSCRKERKLTKDEQYASRHYSHCTDVETEARECYTSSLRLH